MTTIWRTKCKVCLAHTSLLLNLQGIRLIHITFLWLLLSFAISNLFVINFIWQPSYKQRPWVNYLKQKTSFESVTNIKPIGKIIFAKNFVDIFFLIYVKNQVWLRNFLFETKLTVNSNSKINLIITVVSADLRQHQYIWHIILILETTSTHLRQNKFIYNLLMNWF